MVTSTRGADANTALRTPTTAAPSVDETSNYSISCHRGRQNLLHMQDVSIRGLRLAQTGLNKTEYI